MRWAAVAVGVLIAFSLLWGVGEMHRRNCIDDGREGCSVLPWNSGTPYCDTHVCVKPVTVR